MTTPRDLRATAEEPHHPVRKPYQKPELHVYGDLAKITQAVMGSKTNDGSGHPNKHSTS